MLKTKQVKQYDSHYDINTALHCIVLHHLRSNAVQVTQR